MSGWLYGFVVFDSSMNMDKSDGKLLSVFDAVCDFLLPWLLQNASANFAKTFIRRLSMTIVLRW